MGVPLLLKDASGNLQEFTTGEEAYLSYLASLQLLEDSAIGSLNTSSGTSIGSYSNTFFNEAIGTHPSTSITIGTTTTTVYQDLSTALEDSADWRRPLEWKTSGTEGVNEMDDTSLNAAVDRYLTYIFTNDLPGTYKLATSAPAGYTAAVSPVFTDTRTDGTSVVYSLYRRTSFTPPAAKNALHLKRSGDTQDGAYDGGIEEMTVQEMKTTFGQRAKTRINASGIGKYQLRSSSDGAPTDPGTWVAKGTATDTRQQTADQNFETSYVGTFLTNFTRVTFQNFEADYVGTFIGDFVGNYVGTFLTNFEGNFAQIFETVGYDRNFTRNSLSDFVGDFTGDFTGNFLNTFTRNSTTTFTGNFIGDFTGNFATNYTRNFTRNSTRNSTQDFVGDFVGDYAIEYLTNFTRSSTRDSTRNSTRDSLTYYQRNFTRTSLVAYDVNVYIRAYVGDFLRTSITPTNYTRGFTGNFDGNYARNFTRSSTRTSTQVFSSPSGGVELAFYGGISQQVLNPYTVGYAWSNPYDRTDPGYNLAFPYIPGDESGLTQSLVVYNWSTPVVVSWVLEAYLGPTFGIFYPRVIAENQFLLVGGGGGSFTGNFVGNFTGNYVRNFLRASTRTSNVNFLGVTTFEGNYARNFQIGFEGNYLFDFEGNFLNNYLRNFVGDYTGNFVGNFTGNYQGNYQRNFTRNSTTTFTGDFVGDFTGNFATNYTRNFTRNSTRDSTTDFVGDFTGNFQNDFTRNSTRNSTTTFTGDFTGDFVGNFVGTYEGNFAQTFTGNFETTFSLNYVRNFETTYTGTFANSFEGNYQRNFETTYIGTFAGETIQSSSETIETYTLYVRIA